MEPQFIGYNEAVSAMGDKLIDAVWVFAGFPNSSVIQAAASNKIQILDTVEAGNVITSYSIHYTKLYDLPATHRAESWKVLTGASTPA